MTRKRAKFSNHWMPISKFKKFIKKQVQKTVENTFNDANIIIIKIFFFLLQLCLVISLFLSSRLNIRIYFIY